MRWLKASAIVVLAMVASAATTLAFHLGTSTAILVGLCYGWVAGLLAVNFVLYGDD